LAQGSSKSAEMRVALQRSPRYGLCGVRQLPLYVRCSGGIATEKGAAFGLGQGTAAADVPTTDATFRYRNFTWQTSCGAKHEYEYVVAQQPAGGQTARLDALSALEESLPRPPSGWTVVLMPSVSLVCSGKEEMRPLAAALAQRGHRCYTLEWPGWATDMLCNWGLMLCKPEELSAEYEDFWCQALNHVIEAEAKDAAEAKEAVEASGGTAASSASSSSSNRPPRICVVGAGSSGIYAMRSIQALEEWAAGIAEEDTAAVPGLIEALVMIAPSWQTERPRSILSRLQPEKACRLLGKWLHAEDMRFGRLMRAMHFSQGHLRSNLDLPAGQDAERLELAASWLFKRRRPYVPTDAAVMHGLLDPAGNPTAQSLAKELSVCLQGANGSAGVQRRGLVLAPSGPAGQPAKELHAAAMDVDKALAEKQECRALDMAYARPHEIAPTSILVHLDQWLVAARGE